MAHVSLQLTPEAAEHLTRALARRGGSAAGRARETRGQLTGAQATLAAIEEAGGRIQPVHPGVRDATLACFFTIEVADEEAGRLAEFLRALPGVEAAYVKPSAEPP